MGGNSGIEFGSQAYNKSMWPRYFTLYGKIGFSAVDIDENVQLVDDFSNNFKCHFLFNW